jgi:hypothetical protein
MSKSSVSGSGVVTADGLSSLLSTGSRDTGYESITNGRAIFRAKGDSIGNVTSRAYDNERPANYDGIIWSQNGYDDSSGGAEQEEQQPRQSVSDLRRLFQSSNGNLAGGCSEHQKPEDVAPVLAKGWCFNTYLR